MVTVVFRLESTSMKKLSVFGAFRFSEFRIRDCVPVLRCCRTPYVDVLSVCPTWLCTSSTSWTELFGILCLYFSLRSRGSSVSIVSGYGRAIEVRAPAEARDFSCNPCVQTGCGVYPASCTMGTGGPFPWDKARPGRNADLSPHLVPRSWMSRSYTSSFSLTLHRCVVRLLYISH
jgi:hypothetical protein